MLRAALAIVLVLSLGAPAQAFSDDCWDRLRLAEGGGFIKDYWPNGKGLDVVVAEATWRAIPRAAREGAVALLTCGLRDEGEFERITIFGDRSRAVLDEARGLTLLGAGSAR